MCVCICINIYIYIYPLRRWGSLTMTFTGKYIYTLSGFYFTDTDDSQDSKGSEGTIFYSTLSLPPAHEYSDIYFATLHVR